MKLQKFFAPKWNTLKIPKLKVETLKQNLHFRVFAIGVRLTYVRINYLNEVARKLLRDLSLDQDNAPMLWCFPEAISKEKTLNIQTA